MMLVDIIGYAATVVGTCLMLPQLWKSWTTKKVNDVAFGMLLLYFLNCALWGIYGFMIGSNPVIVANVLGFIISILLLVLKMKYR